MTLHGRLKKLYESSLDRPVLQVKTEAGYQKYTYKQFYETSVAIANYLVTLGVKKSDRIAIILENCPQWGMVYFGIMISGAIAVPIDVQAVLKDIEYVLSDCGCQVIFSSTHVIDSFENSSKIIWLEDIEKLTVLNNEFAEIDISENDTASILYTSGTTGNPKGVMLTHGNFLGNVNSIEKLQIVTEKDNVLSILPLHHTFPFMVSLLIPLFLKSTITYVRSLKSEELLAAMQETKVTVFPGVPQLLFMFYQKISQVIEKMPLGNRILFLGIMEAFWSIRKFSGINLSKKVFSLVHKKFGCGFRFFACGGAKLNEDVALFLMKIGFTVIEGYGLTETSPIATLNPLHNQKIGSPGIAIPDVKIKISSADDQGIGEVAIKGPNVMKGYYNCKEETSAVLNDGWFFSGDLGYLDQERYLHLTGREKELIVLSSGKNISPEEVELYYCRSPFFKEICVLTVGDDEDRLLAVIVADIDYYRLKGEGNIQGKIKFEVENLSKQYAAYKRIMGFVITKEELPRTRLGKLKRFAIKDKYQDQLLGRISHSIKDETVSSEEDLKIISSSLGGKILATLKEKAKIDRAVRVDDSMEIDLGIDSLSRVEAVLELEKLLNITIPDSALDGVYIVKDLILTVEALMLDPSNQTGKIPSKQAQSSLWHDMLEHSPSNDVVEKIDLSPGPLKRFGAGVGMAFIIILFKLCWRLKVRGAENLPKDEVFILCPNHGSYLDGFLVASALPKQFRKNMFFVGIRAIFEVPLIRNMLRFIQVISIDPVVRLVDAMRACAYVLKKNKSVCLFSEGGRSIDGEVKEFKKGIGILAKELKVKLVPVYIKGSYESWPRTQSIPQPQPITISFGQSYDADELKKQGKVLGAKDDYEAIARAIREEVLYLKNQ